jgi:hypothetical protein
MISSAVRETFFRSGGENIINKSGFSCIYLSVLRKSDRRAGRPATGHAGPIRLFKPPAIGHIPPPAAQCGGFSA